MKTLKLLPLSSGNSQEETVQTLAKAATTTPHEKTVGALLGVEAAPSTVADATIATVSAATVSQGKGETKEALPNPPRST